MVRQFTAQTNFSSGELDPTMHLRVDTGAYQNGAETLTNVQLLNTGGARRRDGTYYRAGLVGGKARLHQFEFDADENYLFAFEADRVDIFDGTGTFLMALFGGRWNATTMWQMTFAQLGDVLLVFHGGFQPHKITRTGLSTFALGDFAFERSIDNTNALQPFYKFVDDSVTMKTSNETGSVTLTCSAAFFTPSRVGTYIRIHGTPILITAYTSSTVATGTVEGIIKPKFGPDPGRSKKGSQWLTLDLPYHGLAGPISVTLDGFNDIGGHTSAEINTTFTSPASMQYLSRDKFRVKTSSVGTASVDGGGTDCSYIVDNVPVRDWDEQVFNAINGWPVCGTFHQERLYLGGSPELPSGLWASQVGRYFSFDLGTAEPDNSIFISVGQENGVAIRHLVSGKHLQVFSEVGEFFIPQAEGTALTPLSITASKQTPYGSLDVPPVSLDGATIFLQKSKTAVREFIYSDAERSYNANPLSLAATHVLNSPVDLAVLYGTLARPEQYAFLVNADGTMAVFHSARVERLAGWTRWQTAPGAKFHSAAAVNGKLFVCAERFGAFYLEEVASTTELTLDGAQDFTNASPLSVWTGLPTRFYGQTVTVLARDDITGKIASSLGPFVVSGAGTLTLTSAHKNIVVGYDYEFRIKTLTPNLQTQQGTLLGEIKRIAQVQVALYGALGVTVEGQTLDLRQLDGAVVPPPNRVSDYQTYSILGYSREPAITITQADPLPLTVLGLVMKVSV